jgi:tRNA-splicing ligase RtcB
MDAWVKERGVILIGVDLDESPMVYRRLPEVLAETFQHNQNPA